MRIKHGACWDTVIPCLLAVLLLIGFKDGAGTQFLTSFVVLLLIDIGIKGAWCRETVPRLLTVLLLMVSKMVLGVGYYFPPHIIVAHWYQGWCWDTIVSSSQYCWSLV